MNHASDVVKALLKDTAGGAVTVLEVGAGTGATAKDIIPLLSEDDTYIFTDLSPFFFAEARSKFERYAPSFVTAELDIHKPLYEHPTLYSHQVDIVVATNVLHAVPDVSVALDNCRRLLKPGGAIVIVGPYPTLPCLAICWY